MGYASLHRGNQKRLLGYAALTQPTDWYVLYCEICVLAVGWVQAKPQSIIFQWVALRSAHPTANCA